MLSPVTDNCSSWISGRRNESMWPDRVSNPGPLTYESGALPTALRGRALLVVRLIRVHSLTLAWAHRAKQSSHTIWGWSILYGRNKSIRVYWYTCKLFCHFTKGNNFCDWSSVCLGDETPPKRHNHWIKTLFQQGQILYFKNWPHWEGAAKLLPLKVSMVNVPKNGWDGRNVNLK